MNTFHVLILALVQGFCELLPVSSSAHVIMAEKLLGLNPSAPEMTMLLVMLRHRMNVASSGDLLRLAIGDRGTAPFALRRQVLAFGDELGNKGGPGWRRTGMVGKDSPNDSSPHTDRRAKRSWRRKGHWVRVPIPVCRSAGVGWVAIKLTIQ